MRSGTLLLGHGDWRRSRPRPPPRSAAGSVVGVSSGAAAIQITLAALGVGPGDEVIVPAFTAVPTASAVCRDRRPAGARRRRSAHSAHRPASASRRRSPDAHERSCPCTSTGDRSTLDPIADLGLPVVEDAAQARGALAPSASAAVAYSFYPTKNLGGIGDGGAVATTDERLAESIRRRRVHGMTEQYVHVDISQNFRMSEIEAAWLRLQLPHLARGQPSACRDRPPLPRGRAAPAVAGRSPRPRLPPLRRPVHRSRAGARSQLAAQGVATAVQYPLSIGRQPAFRDLTTEPCPEAELWAARVRQPPVLSRADRRRGRDRRRRPR